MKAKNTPRLETDRLLLRKFSDSDLDAILSIFGDREVNAYLPWFPLRSLAEAKIFFEERYAQEYSRSTGYRYAVCLKAENIPIGYVNLSTDESHDLGYGLQKEFWGQDIITEACRAVLAQAKEDGIPYITATHDVKNPRSGSVMQKLGMRYQYSYEEQWQPKNQLVTFRMYQLNFDHDPNRVFRRYWNTYPVHFAEEI